MSIQPEELQALTELLPRIPVTTAEAIFLRNFMIKLTLMAEASKQEEKGSPQSSVAAQEPPGATEAIESSDIASLHDLDPPETTESMTTEPLRPPPGIGY